MDINNEDPSTVKSCIKIISKYQEEGKSVYITIYLCKRKEINNILYSSIRIMFKQLRYKIENDVIEHNVNSLLQVTSRSNTPFHLG